jgi:hypothetical protein
LAVGDKFTAPATGEVKTIYLDFSGQKIGEGVHPLTGETTVIVGQEYLDISTQFQNSTIVAIDVPDQPKKLWHIGLGVVTNFNEVGIGGYIQKDFQFWRNWVAYGRYEQDYDRRLKIGMEVSF